MCVYVSEYACVWECACVVSINVYSCVFRSECAWVCLGVSVHVCVKECVFVCVRVESVYLQVGSCLHMCVQGAGWGVLHSLANVSACVVVVYWYLCFCMRERERMTAL